MPCKTLLRLFACAGLIAIASSASCNDTGKSYMYNSVNWECEHISDVFPTTKSNVNSIVCFDCNIAVIEENTIPTFRGPVFNLSSSHVRKIKQNAFRTFTNNTRKFIFDKNELESVAPKVFSNFSASDEINLRDNRISKLEASTFEGTNVSTLDLSRNSLTDVGSVFNGLRVTTLNLSSNGIKELQQSAFDQVIFWSGGQWKYGTQQLDLSKNLLNKIIPSTFKSPTKDNIIRMLHLQENQLTVIENATFLELNYLWQLHLTGNRISQLYADSFKGLTILNTLSLAKNQLTSLPIGIFGRIKSLVVLDLSQNLLTTLSATSFTGLMNLNTLNISHNNLQTIEDSHLVALGKIHTLDITNTRIHDINLQPILDHHYNLRTLVINDNLWTCSKLMEIYKLTNRRGSGFSYPSRHFDVPNLHGIACSRQTLDSYDDLSFDDFLNIISKDHVFEDVFDYSLHNETDPGLNSKIGADIHSIKGMFVILTILCVVLFLHCVIKYIVAFLLNRNIIRNSPFRVSFGSNHDRVELLN
ncbi:hypothetical protein PPYR_02078 [Photinus pyralis]|uniref:LRRCT domain-containing protein n=2 Tax=Photinus pyralis TaxID=7054 RepID=A0A5N4B6C3_PHOPY|nr:leucine-rich repeat-containing protein 15-like [Photinus pyralis]KAB0805108.1 hypothetical protein PPYR_02078 [Photinus pyralis]